MVWLSPKQEFLYHGPSYSPRMVSPLKKSLRSFVFLIALLASVGAGYWLYKAGLLQEFLPRWAGGIVAPADPFALPEGARLAPHRAVYEITLGETSDEADIAEVRGLLAIELLEACEGFTVNQRIRTEFLTQSDEIAVTDYSISSFESRDGLSYRFAIRIGDESDEYSEYVGQARLNALGGLGKAEYSEPDGLTLELPEGTMFPNTHTAALLRAALRGETFMSATLYEGSAEYPLDHVTAVTLRSFDAAGAADREGLRGLRSWEQHLAFFNREGLSETPEASPDYELTYRLYENGVSDELKMNYGAFVLLGRMVRLDLYEPVPCKSE